MKIRSHVALHKPEARAALVAFVAQRSLMIMLSRALASLIVSLFPLYCCLLAAAGAVADFPLPTADLVAAASTPICRMSITSASADPAHRYMNVHLHNTDTAQHTRTAKVDEGQAHGRCSRVDESAALSAALTTDMPWPPHRESCSLGKRTKRRTRW